MPTRGRREGRRKSSLPQRGERGCDCNHRENSLTPAAVVLHVHHSMPCRADERRVLLVEDDEDTREIMLRLIRRIGCEVRAAGSVSGGVAIIERWDPSEVLLDLMLPDKPGSELLRQVRQARRPVRVALLTAAGPHSETLAAAMQWGPDAVFHKPVLFDEVAAWLCEC